ncbi:MAG TPA: isochorismatase family protein, partial [Ilumatobacteraceae bacterium]
PANTAVLTMELQRAIVGPLALLPALVEEVQREGTLAAAGRVCAAARDVGARVVHCTAEERPDGAGAVANCKIFAMSAKARAAGTSGLTIGSEGARVVAELGDDPRDVTISRLTGMSPFTSTALDQVLRNLGVTTVVATGVSVNLGVFGMVMSAVDLGYQVVLVRDAVAGVPHEYARAVIDNSLSLLATVVSSDELLAAWDRR